MQVDVAREPSMRFTSGALYSMQCYSHKTRQDRSLLLRNLLSALDHADQAESPPGNQQAAEHAVSEPETRSAAAAVAMPRGAAHATQHHRWGFVEAASSSLPLQPDTAHASAFPEMHSLEAAHQPLYAPPVATPAAGVPVPAQHGEAPATASAGNASASEAGGVPADSVPARHLETRQVPAQSHESNAEQSPPGLQGIGNVQAGPGEDAAATLDGDRAGLPPEVMPDLDSTASAPVQPTSDAPEQQVQAKEESADEVSGSVLRQLQRQIDGMSVSKQPAKPAAPAADVQAALGGANQAAQAHAAPPSARHHFCNHATLMDSQPPPQQQPGSGPSAAPQDNGHDANAAAARAAASERVTASARASDSGASDLPSLSEAGKRAMLQACAPLAEHSSWLCSSLFTPDGGAACEGLLRAAPVRSHGGPARRQMLRVGLEGTFMDFCLPALTDAEMAEISEVEQLLAKASYSDNAVVPIFWDTETTGLASYRWFVRNSSRIVQIAAVADGAAGLQEFEIKSNPWPVEMSPGASVATGLTTAQVFAHELPPQVCLP